MRGAEPTSCKAAGPLGSVGNASLQAALITTMGNRIEILRMRLVLDEEVGESTGGSGRSHLS
jgi:hypothetical protein